MHRRRENVTRREVIAAAATLPVAVGCSAGDGGPPTASSAVELLELSARSAVTAMQRGELSAERYATALLEVAAAHADLNAFTTIEPERVLEAARRADRRRAAGDVAGAFHGLPVPVKDSVNTVDYPTTGGTPALRNFVPPTDAEIVRRLKAEGAIVMGKTTVHELSFGWTSNNYAYGAVHNPYDASRVPGGSSGGTAAAIAARMAPLGIAEDTQGSIRVPAALCGICGFRPTTGRYPNGGVIPISPIFDQVGPHTRSVDDVSFFDEVVSGEAALEAPVSVAGTRLGVVRDYFFDGVAAEVARVSEAALQRLADAGAVIVEAPMPGLARLVGLTTAQIQLFDIVPRLAEYLETHGAGVSFYEVVAAASENIRAEFEEFVIPGAPQAVPEADFIAARDVHRPELRQQMSAWFRDHRIDALVFPVTMTAAAPIGDDAAVLIDGKPVPIASAMGRNIAPGSTAGIPGLVLPAGLTPEGLPVALEFDAPEGADRELIALGRSIETVLGPIPAPQA